jgi:phosphatidylglycerophosphatase C
MKTLVLFDFDGTLTRSDSFLAFIQYYHGRARYLAGMSLMGPWIAAHLAGLYPNWKLKQRVLQHFFKGEDADYFQLKADAFSRDVLPGLIRPGVLKRIKSYRLQGARLVVVSASAENWLQLWCKKNKLELVATRLQVVDGKLTGCLEGKNCYGPEKVARLQAYLQPQEYEVVHAYGDSSGDREMLSLATNPFYRHFTA